MLAGLFGGAGKSDLLTTGWKSYELKPFVLPKRPFDNFAGFFATFFPLFFDPWDLSCDLLIAELAGTNDDNEFWLFIIWKAKTVAWAT